MWGFNPVTEPPPGGQPGNRALLAGNLRGEGLGNTIIRWAGAAAPTKAMLVVSNPLSRIEDIQFWGNSAAGNKVGIGVVFHHASGVEARIYVHTCGVDGIVVNGLWYGTAASCYGFNEELHLTGRSYSNGSVGFHIPWDSGGDNGAIVVDRLVCEANLSHGFQFFNQGMRLRDCRAEGNLGYGFLCNGKPGGTYAVDNLIEQPWIEGNKLGGVHYSRAVYNRFMTSNSFADVTQDTDSSNAIFVGSSGACLIRGAKDLVLSSGGLSDPQIYAQTKGATQQPVGMSSLRLNSVSVNHLGGDLSIDVSLAARFAVNLHADVGTLTLAIPLNANLVNAEILLDFVQIAPGAVPWKVSHIVATRIGAAGTPVPVTMRWIGEAIPSIGTVAKANAHDLIRLFYGGDWLEESRTLDVR